MGKVYVLLTCVIALSVGGLALPSERSKPFYKPEDYERHFEEFIKEYGRNYTNEEKAFRFNVFKQKLENINKMNLKYKHAIYGITKFTDYTGEDFATLNCLNPHSDDDNLCQIVNGTAFADVEVDSFDWRNHSVVTEVKYQGECSSCWAFSVIGNVEGQYAIRNKKLLRLSEEQLVDCDKTNNGCKGGRLDKAFRDIIKKGGVMAEADYPYVGRPGQRCKFNKNKVKVSLSDCIFYDTDDEEKLKNILTNVGPLCVAMHVGREWDYKGGIDETPCPANVDHGVLLVGYGSENGVPYWILKNSWGANWGENGFFRLKRGANTRCITMYAPVTGVI